MVRGDKDSLSFPYPVDWKGIAPSPLSRAISNADYQENGGRYPPSPWAVQPVLRDVLPCTTVLTAFLSASEPLCGKRPYRLRKELTA